MKEERHLINGIARTLGKAIEHEHAQDEVARTAQEWQKTFDATNDSIWVLGKDQRILRCNKTTEGLFQMACPELLGKHCWEIMHGSQQASPAECPLQRARITLQRETMELLVHETWCQVTVDPILDESGAYAGAVHITSDISARKQAEKEIQAYQAKLKTLASELTLTEERLKRSVATELHDRISQSLAMCKLHLTALLQEATFLEDTQATLASICEALDQTLLESRELASQLSYPTLTVLGLEKAVEIWLGEEVGQKHGLRTRFQDDGQAKPMGEDVQTVLFRSVREMLTNVIKHARADQVDVTIGRVDTDIVVSVSDNGVGWDVENTRANGGGFGLFSVQEALERLAGAIHIESMPDHGSKITLTLPLDTDDIHQHEDCVR